MRAALADDGSAVCQQAGQRGLGCDAVRLYAACADDGVSLRGCKRVRGWRYVAVIWVRYAYGLHDGISFVVEGGGFAKSMIEANRIKASSAHMKARMKMGSFINRGRLAR